MSNQNKVRSDKEKLKSLMLYWFNHNNEHIHDNEKWLHKIDGMGLDEVSDELRKVIKLSREANKHIELANASLKKEYELKTVKKNKAKKQEVKSKKLSTKNELKSFKFRQIGIIRTPYIDDAPYQPVKEDTWYLDYNKLGEKETRTLYYKKFKMRTCASTTLNGNGKIVDPTFEKIQQVMNKKKGS